MPAIYTVEQRVERDQRNSTERKAKELTWVKGVRNHWKRRYTNADARRQSVGLKQKQRRLSSCKRNRWRAFTVTTGGWVLMFSKLFRVHRTRYKQKCIKVHSDPWLIDRLINLLYYRLLGFRFIKDSIRFSTNLLNSNAKVMHSVNIGFLPGELFGMRLCCAKKRCYSKIAVAERFN